MDCNHQTKMSLELIKTTLGEEHFHGHIYGHDLIGMPTENVGKIFEDWQEKMGGIIQEEFEAEEADEGEEADWGRPHARFHYLMEEVGEKMYVSYITGKTRIIQKWVRSFQELPPCCPCPE